MSSFTITFQKDFDKKNAIVEVANRIKTFCNDQNNKTCNESNDGQDKEQNKLLTIVACKMDNNDVDNSSKSEKLLPKEGDFLIDAIVKQDETNDKVVVTLQSYVHSSLGSKIVSKFMNTIEGEICRTNRKWRRMLDSTKA